MSASGLDYVPNNPVNRELVQVAAVAVATLEARGCGLGNVFAAIQDERQRQDEKWGAGRHLPMTTWLTILTEEVGETAEAILKSGEFDQ
jgi:hypothetical protein